MVARNTVCREGGRLMLRSRRMDLAHVPHRHALRARDAFSPHHPLAEAGAQRAAADERLLLAIAFTVAGTAVLAVTRRDVVTAFILAGSAVSGIAGLVSGALRQALSAVAIATIAAGDDQAGVRELDSARARLADRHVRAGLARSLELYADRPTLPPGARPGSMVQTTGAGVGARETMRKLAEELVREPGPSPRVVALCACLLTDGQTSPLFHCDPVQLDHELRRIRYLSDTAADGAAVGSFGSAPNR
jgi:hypothetical protein